VAESVKDMIMVIEVADTGSFSQAGVRLRVPKSTISQRVAQLEKRLGLQLFNRSTRHVSLTSNGQVYLEHCRRVRAEVAAATLAMSNLKEQPIGSLRITCPEVTASYFMPAFLGGFATRFPQVSIELIATNAHLDLIRERVDFAFRVGSVSNQDLVIRKLSHIRRILVASPDYLSVVETPSEPGDLLRQRCLIHDAMPEWSFSLGTKKAGIKPIAAAKSDSIGFIFQSCLQGNGIALLPAYVCQSAIAAHRLVELLPEWRIPPHELVLVFANPKSQSKAQQAFREYAKGFDFSSLAKGARA
jgi:DNA-binding transcriptional LysR family regulator